MKPKNIILVGLGPHARRIYYPLLEKYGLSAAHIKAAVEKVVARKQSSG